jgi:hypothetical protein
MLIEIVRAALPRISYKHVEKTAIFSVDLHAYFVYIVKSPLKMFQCSI